MRNLKILRYLVIRVGDFSDSPKVFKYYTLGKARRSLRRQGRNPLYECDMFMLISVDIHYKYEIVPIDWKELLNAPKH